MPVVAFLAALATALDAGATPRAPCAQGAVVAPPRAGMTYHAAYPDFGGSEDRVTTAAVRRFEGLAGRRIAWAVMSDNWMRGVRFPGASVARIRAAGTVPLVRIMPRSTWREGAPDPRFALQRIAAGAFDRQLAAWGRAAARSGGPLMVDIAPEMNGDWFPWSGRWNGAGTRAAYGRPAWPDGPERYRDAFRRIVRIVRGSGATNVTWVFHPDASTVEGGPGWNDLRWYYPGDAYVDWIGLSAYGPQGPDEELRSLEETLRPGYRAAAALSPTRPIALLEFGIADASGWSAAAWTRDAFTAAAPSRFPRLRAVAWWHERWVDEATGAVSDLRIDSSTERLTAYRSSAAAAPLTGRARLACR